MVLFLLEPRSDLDEVDPWDPWYDKCFGMVVRADSETAARKRAAEFNDGEGEEAWLNEKYSTCEVLFPFGEEEIILRNCHWA